MAYSNQRSESFHPFCSDPPHLPQFIDRPERAYRASSLDHSLRQDLADARKCPKLFESGLVKLELRDLGSVRFFILRRLCGPDGRGPWKMSLIR